MLKGDLALRPIRHQLDRRIEAHMLMLRAPRYAPCGQPSAICLAASAAARLISFLAYALQITLKTRLRKSATGLTPRAVLEKFATLQVLDVHLPTTDGREIVIPRYTPPEPALQLLLDQLKLQLPAQPPPKITIRK